MDGMTFPGPVTKDRYIGGRIQTVDIDSGKVTDLYTECDGRPLWAPNDLVFDAHGGFYFTDHGLSTTRSASPPVRHLLRQGGRLGDPRGRLPGARAERHRPVARRLEAVLGRDLARANHAARHRGARRALRARPRRHVAVPLRLPRVAAARLAGGRRRRQRVRRDDRQRRRISVVSPAGELVDFVATGDIITTNICFGGDDLTTAYITISTTGGCVKTTWPRPGAKLHYLNT